jgi:hypothetical protein
MELYGDGSSFGDVAGRDGKALVCAAHRYPSRPYEGLEQQSDQQENA